MTEKKYPVKRKEVLELDIEKVGFGGNGIAKINDYVIFVKRTIPGDKIKAVIQKRKPGYAEARLLEILNPSGMRRQAPCEYFGWCGGCTWQNLDYKQQLQFKKEHVQESLIHIGGFNDPPVNDVLSSQNIFAYRNKMEFSFSDRRWLLPHELGQEHISKDYALGLHVPGTFDKILQVDNCLLQSDVANQILRKVNQLSIEHELEPYGIKSHEGFLRFLVIRESHYTGEIMVNIVTSKYDADKMATFAEKLHTEFSEIKSIVNVVNDKKAQIAFGDQIHVLYGKPYITEQLCDMEFKISANSFFQTNTKQAENLFNKTLEYASPQSDQLLWDLYSGTGTISLLLAQKAQQVTGFELVQSAVEDARKNAYEHNISNVKFIAGDLLDKMREIKENPDLIITDPPRAGMHHKVVRFMARKNPARIVYVSCNPTTLARDLSILAENYNLKVVQPVDMFPHTYHIENIALLERK